MRRVLFLAQQTPLPYPEIPPHGSGAHVAATLAGLTTHFEVLPLGLEEDRSAPTFAPLRRARRFVPARVRGLRQDAAFVAADRAFFERGMKAAVSFRPDVIYERDEYLAAAGLRLSSRLGIPLILEVNGLIHLDEREFYRSLGEPLGAMFQRRKYRCADALVVVNPGLGRRLSSLGARPERIAVVPNSVRDDRVRLHPRSPRASDDIVFGWVGHVMSWHRVHDLVDAVRIVLDSLPAARFRVVGGGAGLDELRARATRRGVANSFEFPGPIRHELVSEEIASWDVGVVAGFVPDSFPVKVAEIGALGVPMVAPRTGPVAELLQPAVDFQPFRLGDVADLARALVAVGEDYSLRARLGASLHAAVRDRLTWSVTGRQLADVVETALRGHRASAS